jgi:RNA polymerase sigma-54 factor
VVDVYLHNTVKTEQKVAMSPNLQQSLHILTMNNMELTQFIGEECIDNPVLEISENNNGDSQEEYIAEKLSYLEKNKEKVLMGDLREQDDYFEKGYEEEITLEKHLLSQIDGAKFTKAEMDIIALLIKMIDENGFLKETPEELSELFATDQEVIQKLLSYIKELAPTGVGSKDFKECLKRQLEFCGKLNEELKELIDTHLELLAKGNFAKAGRLTGISSHKIKEYFMEIKRLNPIPGNGFGKREAAYIIPDVTVSFNGREPIIALNDKYIPKVQISSYWYGMLQEVQRGQEDKEVMNYLTKKFEHASYMINALESRRYTLLNVCTALVDRQYLFLKTGKKSDLIPLRLKDIASEVGVHESTVSRTLQNKYMGCPWGVVSLKSFFTGAVSKNEEDLGYEDAMSKEAIKHAIKALIQEEDKSNPVSDTKIAEWLQIKNIHISRRTVVKYREELNIGNSFQRKE